MKLRYLYIVLVLGFFLALPSKVEAAARFFLSPSSGSYKVGETVKASVMVDTGGTAINAVEGSVSFPEDTLTYQSVGTSGSIITFWTSGPTGSSTKIDFSGGLSNPGYTGSSGKILDVTWKVKSVGSPKITIHGSKILANDGTGSNIYGSSSGGTFTIGAKSTPAPTLSLSSSTHPDQSKWYSNKSVLANWISNGASGYSFAFDQSASTIPLSDYVLLTNKTFAANDGIWYLHVIAKSGTNTIGPSHYKVQIDSVPPESFDITIKQNGGLSNPSPVVSFEAVDTLSGVERYELTVDNGEPTAIKNGDTLPKQRPGTHSVRIKAYDKAGNSREATASYKIEGIAPPTILSYSKLVGLLKPVIFSGRSAPEDTIIVWLNDKEVDRFIAGDKKMQSEDNLHVSSVNNDITWEYSYTQAILPGQQIFRFSRIDTNGAESETSKPISVEVSAATTELGSRTIKTTYLFAGLLSAILILLIIVIYLSRKVRWLAKNSRHVGIALTKIMSLFKKVEHELDKEIDRAMPNQQLEKTSIITAKQNLKTKIHEVIEEESKEI